MAISNVVGGNGFKGALSYIMQKPEASHIGRGGVFSSTPEEIALEMRLNANQKSISKPVMHCSLSLEPGEKATPEQLQVLGETWLREMGFDLDKTQYTITRHSDRDHDHIHILANRVMLDGKVLSTSHERRRSHEATRVAEQAAGLRLFQDREKSQSKGRGHLHELRQSVDRAIASAGGDMTRFKSLLEAQGLKLVENRSATTGRLFGIGYEDAAGRLWKGSSLGKYYSAAGLQRSGLDLGYEAGSRKDQQQGQGQSKSQGGKREQTHAAGQAARVQHPGADRTREPHQQIAAARDINSIRGEIWNKRRAAEQAKDEAAQRRKQRAAEDEDEI